MVALQPSGPALQRSGPSPLVLHMAMARWQYAGAQAALASVAGSADRSWPGADPDRLAQWQARFGDLPKEAVSAALVDHCQQRLSAFLDGVERYQAFDFHRPDMDRPVAASVETARALDCGGDGPAVLLVPSLINPHWVLDLLPGRSFAASLAASGLRVFAIDWGQPGAPQSRYSLSDYIANQLLHMIEALSARHGRLHLVGYCLGGNLALGAALRAQRHVRSLTAIATPWDFAAMGPGSRALVRETYRQLSPLLARTGLMPAEALQGLFAQLDPTQIERKFNSFAQLDAEDPVQRKKMEHFVAVEDWSNSGPALSAGAAEDCLNGFYHANAALKGAWQVMGAPVDPHALTCPTMVLAALKDRIVPPASTLALAQQLPSPHVLEVDAGHVGMMVGSRAEALCWQPVADWLSGID